ncbi:uncharacterized protein RVIR1_12280 [Candidatus Rickettsiella viridis]|uniref:Murein L,D-transpeptidase catalytic domain family protein n=1 Tax=Candidatus Rickettsiella viridis TaxID=676208 RepID=A0A2Z5V7Q0_9COXI|nr:uncharacterized protein RVIR1_12280 [Candidatus Rickettsiella viridis]
MAIPLLNSGEEVVIVISKKITSLLLLASGLFTMAVSASPTNDLNVQNEINQFRSKAPGLSPKALQVGLEAYSKARQQGLDKQRVLTIVDFTKPSTARRLWVLDLNKHTVLFNDYVAHGQNSGANYANNFSDNPGSLASSLGVFLTESTYGGKHGYSLRVKGLDKGFNDKAESRDIVFHRADYATAQFAQAHGRLGRSWGCFAVIPAIADSLIHTIKDGTLVVAYYPDPSWLSKSQFLS